jgi:uncharacterized membrane protein YgcG
MKRVASVVVVVAAMVCAPVAGAAITPSASLNQSAGTQAGTSVSLGTTFSFAPANNDSPKDLTINLPPGLLANASINNGACLKTTSMQSACQVASGTVSAETVPLGIGLPVPVSVPISLYLVAPPHAGDLAGLAIKNDMAGGTALGSPGAITIRPSDAGVTIAFTNIPNSVSVGGIPTRISVQSMQTTLTGMRLPTSCPATPASVSITVDSYSDGTRKTASAPLHVTGCSTLPLTPSLTVTAVKDSADSGVQVTTDVKQPASPPQATGRTVVLTLPTTVFAPNVLAVLNGGILCANPASGTCKSIGTASSTSPLYPTALTGKAYLTGSLTAPQIALEFPAPFPISLAGQVDLTTGATTFHNVPDLPLTDLKVVLAGGPNSVFTATCNPASGTASTKLTSQDGDLTKTVSDDFTVSGCPAGGGPVPPGGSGGSGGSGGGSGSGSSGGGGSTGGGSGPGPGGGTGSGPTGSGGQTIASVTLGRLASGLATLRLAVLAGGHASKIAGLVLTLPAGVHFRTGRAHKGHPVSSIRLIRARLKGVKVVHGRLVISLRSPARAFTVRLWHLIESAGLVHAVRHHHLRAMTLRLTVLDAAGKRTQLVIKLVPTRKRPGK